MMGVPASLTNAMDLAGDQNVISALTFLQFVNQTTDATRFILLIQRNDGLLNLVSSVSHPQHHSLGEKELRRPRVLCSDKIHLAQNRHGSL